MRSSTELCINQNVRTLEAYYNEWPVVKIRGTVFFKDRQHLASHRLKSNRSLNNQNIDRDDAKGIKYQYSNSQD